MKCLDAIAHKDQMISRIFKDILYCGVPGRCRSHPIHPKYSFAARLVPEARQDRNARPRLLRGREKGVRSRRPARQSRRHEKRSSDGHGQLSATPVLRLVDGLQQGWSGANKGAGPWTVRPKASCVLAPGPCDPNHGGGGRARRAVRQSASVASVTPWGLVQTPRSGPAQVKGWGLSRTEASSAPSGSSENCARRPPLPCWNVQHWGVVSCS